MMTVRQLREYLRRLPRTTQDLPVAYALHSEHCLLTPEDMQFEDLQPARPDGWVPNARPDKPTQTYFVLP